MAHLLRPAPADVNLPPASAFAGIVPPAEAPMPRLPCLCLLIPLLGAAEPPRPTEAGIDPDGAWMQWEGVADEHGRIDLPQGFVRNAVVDGLGLKKVVIAGWSLGGLLPAPGGGYCAR